MQSLINSRTAGDSATILAMSEGSAALEMNDEIRQVIAPKAMMTVVVPPRSS